ncbi:hypothetical protein ACIBG4_40645 [Nonomuraea sp. NPDC050383]|uniref:hypothetical protein n=1 Tax=Nonomuraea sp. NPDC050383 TaxID=3364362 RepID=UPI0037974634
MATVRLYLAPEEAAFASTAFPQYQRNAGTNFPVTGLAFDGAGTTAERAYWKFEPAAYGSGSITCDIIFYNDASTAGACVWEAALAAITPETDTQDVENKSFATAQQVTKAHPGTTAQRLQRATITISNLDSIAAGDEAWLRISRLPNDGADTSTADVILTSVRLSYSDT